MLAVAAIGYTVLVYVVGAQLKPGYSSVSQYVSELNATGTASAEALGLFGFLPLALLLGLVLLALRGAVALDGRAAAGWWLLWGLPASFLLGLAAPCDPGCPADGSAAQLAHNAGGVAVYVCMALGLYRIAAAPAFGPRLQQGLRLGAAVFLVLFLAMTLDAFADVRGLLQRLADVVLALALLGMTWGAPDPEMQQSGA